VELAGRVALVTGAGRRVGRALAEALGRERMRVGVHYHESAGGAREAVAAIRESGGEGNAWQADLREALQCARLVDEVAGHFGGIDVLVNSAAIMVRTPLSEVTPATWDAIMAVNLRAPFFCAQAAAQHMKQAGGAIVNIADLAGLEVWPAYVPHGVSKAGVIHLTRSLARALAPGIRVNAIAPGTVLLPDDWTDADGERLRRTTPLQRHGTPDDVVAAMLYLLTADYVTGETLVVDGGRHVR
jgi:pteridine reductase